jgi:hypothetical protein
MRSLWVMVSLVSFVVLGTSVLLAALWIHSSGPRGPDCDSILKPPEQLSPVIATEVEFEGQGDEEKHRPFFDDFAWKQFIALNWPADETRRGLPHPTKTFGDTSGPIVWGSWKSVAELFPSDPKSVPPTPWDSFDAVFTAPGVGKNGTAELYPLNEHLPAGETGKAKVLGQYSKLGDLFQGDFVGPSSPLVAQNKTFVRYEVRVNRVEYEFVQDKVGWIYLLSPNAKLEFPCHSITVKAAWRELPDDQQVRSKFYHVPAKVVDWNDDGKPVLLDREMGLVGLHIVHKTPKRKNWVWMTFEHVDNTELSPCGISPPSFNSKDGGMTFETPGTNVHPQTFPAHKPLPQTPTPVEVARKTPIHCITAKVNEAYHNHPQIKGTVWRNYRLVATQWPFPPCDCQFPVPPSNRFPEKEVANATMETYKQQEGCINCHNAASAFQFVFYPRLRARPPGDAQGVAEPVQPPLKKEVPPAPEE